MRKESKPELPKGIIYLKNGVWVVRYETKGTVTRVNYRPILEEDTKNLVDPYDQGKETCFEIITKGENLDQYVKLWSTSKMVQELQYYFENTSQEQIDKDWAKVEEFDLVGPTVSEFLGENEGLKMIPKKEMKQGWYNGHCRNNHMAYWDEKDQMFYYIRYSFNFYMDKIEHFEDVKDKRQDGFIPIERIERINWVDINRIKEEVGY